MDIEKLAAVSRPFVEGAKARRKNLLYIWIAVNCLLSLWLIGMTKQHRHTTATPSAINIIETTNTEIQQQQQQQQQPVVNSGKAHDLEASSAAQINSSTSTPSTSSSSLLAPLKPQSQSPMELGAKVAVIIETRVSGNLVPIMLHFMHVLGPGWKMVLYTLESEWILPASTPFRHAVDSRRILIRWLPRNTSFASHHSVSVFLTRPWLWEQLHAAHRILLFQRDSILCTNAPQTVDDFLQYDFVGAPIGAQHGHGYNGGLSVRNPKLMLSIVTNESLSFDEDAKSGKNQLMFEDQWFYTQMTALGVDRVNLPSPDVARTFAVETIDYDNPLGYHQPDRWQKKNLERIKNWCPEVGMLIAPRYH